MGVGYKMVDSLAIIMSYCPTSTSGIKVNCGRCAVANECILREVQLLENMLIEDIKLWGVEEAADNSAKKR